MSDAFNVAARIPMGRKSFDDWLASSVRSPKEVVDFSAMYRGWYWETSAPPLPPDAPEGATVRAALAERLDDIEATLTLVAHVDGHLLLFDMVMVGPDHARAQHTMSILAGAGPHLPADAKGYFVYWADISGRLPDKSGVLSLAEITASGARFLARTDLAKPRGALKKTLAFLAPVERLFGELVSEALGDGSYPNAEVVRSAKYVDPAVFL